VPDPSSPTTVIAEYGTRFEADVAIACLSDHGIESRVRSDPAYSVAPHLVSDPGFRVEVYTANLDEALVALGLDTPPDPVAEQLDRDYFFVGFGQRPRWIRVLALTGIVAIAAPVVVTAAVLLVKLIIHVIGG
jgi:hypothetical protein